MARRSSKACEKAIEAGDMEALRDALTYRQRRFCEEFIVDYNATAAAIRAGYNHGKSVEKQAHQLAHHVGCVAYIEHLEADKRSKIISVSPEYVIGKAVKNIEEAEQMKNLSAVFRGLELLARHLGMLTDKQEITGKDGGAIEFEQRVKEDVRDFTNKLKTLADKAKKDIELL